MNTRQSNGRARIRYETSPLMFRSSPITFIFWLLTIPLIIGAVALLFWYVSNRCNRVVVTDKTVMHKRGVFSKVASQVSIPSIRTVNVHQSLVERMFNTGSIALYTAGDRPEIVVNGIDDPESFRRLLYTIMEESESS